STRLQNYAKRESAIDWLEQDLKDQDLDPYRDKIIVAGDFNTDFYQSSFSDEKTFNKLSKLGFKNTYVLVENEKRITIPSREGEPWPDGTFDYIWISSGWRLPDLKATVLMEGASKRKDVFGGDEPGLASDHYPVYIDIPVTKN
ncbi:MAG: endonuclease/exonuclease/phosphatase family protein, partial [Verrucomicrobiota bacterium]